MAISRRGTPRPLASLLLASVVLAACSTSESPRSSSAAPTVSSVAPSARPTASPTPSPTPAPTPRFTNEADPELQGLIPATAGGATLVVPPVTDFALTPGDIGEVFGKIGDRFASLAIAYAEQPRTTLYAVRVDGDPVVTEELEPHLAQIGRYVGIAGLHREPWELTAIGDHLVWVRGEDDATAAGTMIYTWAAGEFIFVLIGVDDAVNRALLGELPGEAPPTPTPRPSGSPSASSRADPSPSAGG